MLMISLQASLLLAFHILQISSKPINDLQLRSLPEKGPRATIPKPKFKPGWCNLKVQQGFDRTTFDKGGPAEWHWWLGLQLYDSARTLRGKRDINEEISWNKTRQRDFVSLNGWHQAKFDFNHGELPHEVLIRLGIGVTKFGDVVGYGDNWDYKVPDTFYFSYEGRRMFVGRTHPYALAGGELPPEKVVSRFASQLPPDGTAFFKQNLDATCFQLGYFQVEDEYAKKYNLNGAQITYTNRSIECFFWCSNDFNKNELPDY